MMNLLKGGGDKKFKELQRMRKFSIHQFSQLNNNFSLEKFFIH